MLVLVYKLLERAFTRVHVPTNFILQAVIVFKVVHGQVR